MAHLTPEAHRHLATHHGVASVADLIACGLTVDRIERIRAHGGLTLAIQGAYRTPSVPFDELGRCAAVCVAHPELVISGPTAGRLWGFRRLPKDDRIHVIAPPRSHPTTAPWVVPYRTAAIRPEDVVERSDGIRVTTRARTALDLARSLTALDLRSVTEQAMREGGHSEAEMFEVAADWVTPGRPWVRRYLQQLERRVRGGPAESHSEVVLGEALESAGIAGLVRQHHIELPGYGTARFDLAVPAVMWAIEIDVHPSHLETPGVIADRRRDDAAVALGWLVSRVLEPEFGDSLPATTDRLVAVYRQRRRTFRQR